MQGQTKIPVRYKRLIDKPLTATAKRGKKLSKRGRSLLENDHIRRRLLNMISNGVHPHVACQAVGITPGVLYTAMERGHEGASQFTVRFVKQIKAAEAMAEVALVEQLREQTEKDARATVTMLERRFPERWAKRTEQQITLDVEAGAQTKKTISDAIKNSPKALEHLRGFVNESATVIDHE